MMIRLEESLRRKEFHSVKFIRRVLRQTTIYMVVTILLCAAAVCAVTTMSGIPRCDYNATMTHP